MTYSYEQYLSKSLKVSDIKCTAIYSTLWVGWVFDFIQLLIKSIHLKMYTLMQHEI